MIYSLDGTITEFLDDALIIEVNGVGYQVFIPMNVRESITLGSQTKLFISHVIREDSETLFGFTSREDRHLFGILTSVSGMGPKGAIKALSVWKSTDLIQAIATENVAMLTQVPGIGKKLAERLIVELKDKLAIDITFPTAANTKPIAGNLMFDLASALKSLNFSQEEIRRALSNSEGLEPSMTVEAALKIVLKRLM